ncbi:MAG: galactokinase [Ruminococcus sp.]|nr:galactokinase [Ruminococcus sp.]
MNLNEFVNAVTSGAFDDKFEMLYGASDRSVLRHRARYLSAAENFSRIYPQCGEIRVFSAPGRTEIGGNHTDHQHGRVIAAAVDTDAIAIVSLNDENIIRITSSGFPDISIVPGDTAMRPDERNTTAALVRGIAAGFTDIGVEVGGFDAYITSEIAPGSGLASSAAFEVLTAYIIDRCFNAGASSPFELAGIAHAAESSYYGKASGLMDQTVSAVGGFVFIDFGVPEEPAVRKIGFDFSRAGYSLCITNTGEDHAAASEEYSAITAEMKSVAKALGKKHLADCSESEFYEKLPELRKVCGDRAILRAAHFFGDDLRAELEADALSIGDTVEFFNHVNGSGRSSCELLQNIYSCREPERQGVSIALMMSRRFLGENGAVRVHGGGFGGTVQAFVPNYLTEDYTAEMERIFGPGSCRTHVIRPAGAYELEK